ncbi:inactive TPR repeat-containing thioredoxin TTL3 [Carica papaya]|uniref:inactive TPR repeat-containing thioredoxin TTL3 n=1 Tax=Carica papaya TaxID=3649 RepID=UPI000B8CDD6D|nr:inactive TPR repeat-containing thioredoxin TTL3 [Carica papaya]
MEENSGEKRSGCGLLNAVFGKRGFWPKKPSSIGDNCSSNNEPLDTVAAAQKPVARTNVSTAAPLPSSSSSHARKPSHDTAKAVAPTQNQQGRRVPKETIGISGELESMIADHQKAKGSNTLVRASSSNVMLFGNLGNLRQPGGGGGGNTNTQNVLDSLPKTAREERTKPPSLEQAGSLCRALSTRMDPETLKMMGNEDYKNGNFAEALALYEAAIAIDPNKASYRSNKSAALTALGRILEAVFECREAIRIEPHYHRAHHRLANLYLRLGEVENAIYHYKHAGPEADGDDIAKAKSLQFHLNKCTEAKRLRDWNTLVKEAASALSSGADSAPQIYALQAEAFLRLHKHQDADEALCKGPKFDVDSCTKFFGAVGNANLLVVRAQVDMAAGRFDDALAAVEGATKLDMNNREVKAVLRRAKAVAMARSQGNDLFKESRFTEACFAYSEGLQHDPYNSVLLCNRATSRSKLGQFDKALEDCNLALNLRPNYTKARLRRAQFNAKLRNWAASIQDYEMLQSQTQGDEEVGRGLAEAQLQLKKQRAHVDA